MCRGVTQIEVKALRRADVRALAPQHFAARPAGAGIGRNPRCGHRLTGVQAALSGHRLICTLHAASPGGAVARLFEMGMEPVPDHQQLVRGRGAAPCLRRRFGSRRIPRARAGGGNRDDGRTLAEGRAGTRGRRGAGEDHRRPGRISHNAGGGGGIGSAGGYGRRGSCAGARET